MFAPDGDERNDDSLSAGSLSLVIFRFAQDFCYAQQFK